MTLPEYNICVDKFADNLFRFVIKNIRDKQMAEDIVQDSFEKLWVKHENVQFLKAKSYLFTTAYHTLIDYVRKNRPTEDISSETLEVKESNPVSHDVKEIIDQAVNKLPENQRISITLRDYEGYSYEEISKITGMSQSQVKVNIFRGRLALKKFIGNPKVLI